MHPILFEIGGYVVPTYGATLVGTFFLCLVPLLRYFPREILSYFDIYNFFLIMIAIIVGGNLIQLLVSQHFDLHKTFELYQFRHLGNFSSYPTLIATLILMFGYCKIRHIPYLATLDFLFPYALLALAIQRTFGCFMAGCCYGLPTDLPWGVHFPIYSSAGRAFPHLAIHPTQLYYGFSTFAIWVFLISYPRLYKYDRQAGEVTAMGLMLLSVTYFIITFFRGDMTDISSFTGGQWAAGGLFLVGMVLYVGVRLSTTNPRNKTKYNESQNYKDYI